MDLAFPIVFFSFCFSHIRVVLNNILAAHTSAPPGDDYIFLIPKPQGCV